MFGLQQRGLVHVEGAREALSVSSLPCCLRCDLSVWSMTIRAVLFSWHCSVSLIPFALYNWNFLVWGIVASPPYLHLFICFYQFGLTAIDRSVS